MFSTYPRKTSQHPGLLPYAAALCQSQAYAGVSAPPKTERRRGRSCQPLQGSCKKSLQLTLHTAFSALLAMKELKEDSTEHLVSY